MTKPALLLSSVERLFLNTFSQALVNSCFQGTDLHVSRERDDCRAELDHPTPNMLLLGPHTGF